MTGRPAYYILSQAEGHAGSSVLTVEKPDASQGSRVGCKSNLHTQHHTHGLVRIMGEEDPTGQAVFGDQLCGHLHDHPLGQDKIPPWSQDRSGRCSRFLGHPLYHTSPSPGKALPHFTDMQTEDRRAQTGLGSQQE